MTDGAWNRGWAMLVAFAGYLAVVLVLHVADGATDSGFGSVDDEPAHFVTGLMFRDYVAQGFPGAPLDYAKEYYLHYPKVGLGQWPPVFYLVQGLWMLVFGFSTFSLIALMSVMTALVSTLIFGALRRDGPVWEAASFGLLFALLPTVQISSGAVMTEIPLALFCLLAALQFGRFLNTERARHVFAFALFSILAILTKGNAFALGLVPLLAIALVGKWHLLRRPALWGSGALVVVLCGPWYKFALPISASTWEGGGSPTLGYSLEAIGFYARHLAGLGGFALTALVVVGAILRPAEPERRARWAALVAVAISLLLMHIVVPSSITSRHLVLVAPAWVLLSAGGLWQLRRTSFLTRPGVARLAAVGPALVLAIFAAERFEIPKKSHHGYRDAVATLVADETLAGSRLVIVSDALGEGLFIAALAQAESRPGHYVLRGSKVLYRTDWMGDEYEAIFETSAALEDYLKSIPAAVLVLDLATRADQTYPVHAMLRERIEADPDTWQLIGTFDVCRHGVDHAGALRFYRLFGHEDLPLADLDFKSILGREVPGF